MINKFDDFVNEYFGISAAIDMNPNSSFGYSDLSQFGGNGDSRLPYDSQLSFDEYDAHKNNLQHQIGSFVNITKQVFGNNATYTYNEILDDLKDITIINVFKNNNFLLDFYLKFTYNEDVYHCKIEDYGDNSKMVITSKIFDSNILNVINKKKLLIIIKDSLFKWLVPEINTKYQCLYNVSISNNTGTIDKLPIGSKIMVQNISIKNDNIISITIEYETKLFVIDNIDKYLFNYYFKKITPAKFYI